MGGYTRLSGRMPVRWFGNSRNLGNTWLKYPIQWPIAELPRHVHEIVSVQFPQDRLELEMNYNVSGTHRRDAYLIPTESPLITLPATSWATLCAEQVTILPIIQITAATWIECFLPILSLKNPAARAPAKDPADMEAVMPPYRKDENLSWSMSNLKVHLEIAIRRIEVIVVLACSYPCWHGRNIKPEQRAANGGDKKQDVHIIREFCLQLHVSRSTVVWQWWTGNKKEYVRRRTIYIGQMEVKKHT